MLSGDDMGVYKPVAYLEFPMQGPREMLFKGGQPHGTAPPAGPPVPTVQPLGIGPFLRYFEMLMMQVVAEGLPVQGVVEPHGPALTVAESPAREHPTFSS